MDPINNTVAGLMDLFNKRMAQFEAQLQREPAEPSNTSNLAAEFFSFRVFITQAVTTLQQQVELLARNIDSMEMRGRRGILLLHGVPEDKEEDAAQLVVDVVRDRLKVSGFTLADIKRSHRMGKTASASRSRPILVKLRDVAVRDNIWFKKTQLKGAGITISEFLTKSRHDLFMAARKKFGVSKCWTRDGCVYVIAPDGSRRRITTFADIGTLKPQDAMKFPIEPEIVDTPQKPIIAGRSKRAAAIKK
ncbi:hypothetical protein HW555_011242 [Spodoptera exigua]|uniref:Uncharacterized protein n=1 Tax=Spodoptera exigua TaxID=7107 RepID=A0A835G596_SPOEX|nr:hypothetical protein HW555_012311 [Spodoptera exigua]KAF9409377.1 hypothetical protein HW555_011242 [Spodoptera exigua]